MSLVRSSLLVGSGAIASRLLGFARDVLFAQVLGAGPVADAFLAAFRVPNVIRRTLGEGGLNPALVPALARLPPTEAPRFVGEVFTTLALILVALIAVVELCAGLAIFVLAPGLAEDPATFDLAALYARLAFPLVFGLTLASFVSAALNHRRRFLAATLAPLAMNAVLVVALAALRASALSLSEQAAWLATTASIAGLVQLAAVAGAFRGADAPIRLAPPRWSRPLKKLLAQAGLAMLAGSAVPLVVLVGTQAASFQPSGLSWLYYADRLVQLPLSAFGAVTGIVLLPELASRHVSSEPTSAVTAQNRALSYGLLLACPAAMALVILAEPIAAILFERGAFGPDDTRGTAAALMGMSMGLPFAAAGKVLAQSLFARGDMRATLAALLAGLVATAAASLLLGPVLGVRGFGLAIATGFAAHAGVLGIALHRDDRLGFDRALAGQLGRTMLATLALGVALVLVLVGLDERPEPLALAALCLGGLGFYALAALATGALPRSDLALLSKKA
jgi:putative peptidoglycan lipid II flippase